MNLWYKKHPEYLKRENDLLSSNSNYKEVSRSRENLLVSCGEIVVRLNKLKKYPVLIVFHPATPYALPSIFPLKNLLDQKRLDEISKLDFAQIAAHLKDEVEYHYHRHQNPNGSLCILEADNLSHNGANYYSITDILNRLRDWFAYLTTDTLSFDNRETELFYHYPIAARDMEIIIPEQFYITQLVQGEFYCVRHVQLPAPFKSIYVGLILHGQNQAGVSFSPQAYPNPNILLFTPLPESVKNVPLDLIKPENQALLEKSVKEKTLLKGIWWSINQELTPFKNFPELATLVGSGNTESGMKKIIQTLTPQLKKYDDEFFLAIKFPNRSQKFDWQFFKLVRRNKERGWIMDPGFSDLVLMLNGYEIQAIHGEELSEEKFHLRNSTRANRKKLKDTTVSVIGCGALGSEIADSLAKAGVGNISLIDNQELHVSNTMRHTSSLERIGMPKVLGIWGTLIAHNPFVQVIPIGIDVLQHELNSYLPTDSIGISAIADDNTEGFINEQAVLENKTVFYARALRGGKTARIIRVIPGVDACLNCLRLYNDEHHPDFIAIQEDKNFPTLKNECNNPIRPASAADIKMISAITSRILIDHLQDGDSKSNHWIWTTEQLENLSFDEKLSSALHTSHLPPHSKCQYCHVDENFNTSIEEDALTFMIGHTQINRNVETGGILIGYKTEDRKIKICDASEAGPKAKRTPTSFEKDIAYCQKCLNDKYVESNGKKVYLGEWHYHPIGSNKPSPSDLKSLSDISIQKEYLTENPVMIILSYSGSSSCTIHPSGKRYYFSSLKIIQQSAITAITASKKPRITSKKQISQ